MIGVSYQVISQGRAETKWPRAGADCMGATSGSGSVKFVSKWQETSALRML